MKSLNFFIIFHEKNFPENIPHLSYFIYLGANELVKKQIHPDTKHPIIYEYDTPGYNPIYQMLNFCDNSIILNIKPPATEFIGLCQYDMYIDKDKIIEAIDSLTLPNSMVGFYAYYSDAATDLLESEDWSLILDVYNSINKTSHTFDSLSETPFFLMNTFIIPSYFFLQLQATLKLMLPTIFKILTYNLRHIAGTLERTNSLIIACAIKEKMLIPFFSDACTDKREQTATCIRINRD